MKSIKATTTTMSSLTSQSNPTRIRPTLSTMRPTKVRFFFGHEITKFMST